MASSTKNRGLLAPVPDVSDDDSDSSPQPRTYHESQFKLIAPHGMDGRTFTYSSFQGPPPYARIIELLYSDPRTPWKTASDVHRAFLDLGCEHYGGILGGEIIPGVLHSLRMMNALVDRARESNDFLASIDQLDREVQRLVDGGMRESAVGLVHQYREAAKALPDRILKRKIVGDINQRFAYLLTGNQGRKEHERPMSMMATDDEE